MHGTALGLLSIDPFGDAAEPGRAAAFLVLLAFLLSFLFIRTSARMIRAQVSWWPGNVETSSGLHLHHLVWGISLMLLSSFIAFAMDTPASPWYQICAIGFGIGAGLTFDEFALWVNLRDVYWTQQGRISLDAVVLVTVFMGLVVIGSRPFGLQDDEAVGPVIFAVAQAFALSTISFLKGRIGLGTLAIFVPGLGLWGAIRLGKPNSPWGRRRYSGRKLERAQARFPPDSLGHRVRDGFLNAIGGKPSEPEPASMQAAADSAVLPDQPSGSASSSSS